MAPLARPAAPPPHSPNATSYTSLLRALDRRTIVKATMDDASHVARVVYRDGATAAVRYPASDSTLAQRMASDGVDVSIASGSAQLLPLLLPLFALAFMVAAGIFIATRARRRARPQPEAGHAAALSVLDAEVTPSTTPETRFADVAGCDEAVEELAEVVEFLRTPERFALVDARMPAGLLLSGPPGTGKTMLARAGRRGRRLLLRCERLGVRREVRRRRREQSARSLQARDFHRSVGDLHRRDRRNRQET